MRHIAYPLLIMTSLLAAAPYFINTYAKTRFLGYSDPVLAYQAGPPLVHLAPGSAEQPPTVKLPPTILGDNVFVLWLGFSCFCGAIVIYFVKTVRDKVFKDEASTWTVAKRVGYVLVSGSTSFFLSPLALLYITHELSVERVVAAGFLGALASEGVVLVFEKAVIGWVVAKISLVAPSPLGGVAGVVATMPPPSKKGSGSTPAEGTILVKQP